MTAGVVTAYPRQRLIESIQDICREALSANILNPGTAAKLAGKLSFAASAMFNRLGRAAMRPIIQREYFDQPPFTLSRALGRSLCYIFFMLQMDLRRVFKIQPLPRLKIIISSGAQADSHALPSDGACSCSHRNVHWPSSADTVNKRWSSEVTNPETAKQKPHCNL